MLSDTSASCLLTLSTGTFEGVFTFDYPPGQAPVDITMTISALLVDDDNSDNNTDSVEIGEHPGNGGGEESSGLVSSILSPILSPIVSPILSPGPSEPSPTSDAGHSDGTKHNGDKPDKDDKGDKGEAGPVTETKSEEEGGLLSVVTGLLGILL
jgi:hypothetical protein